jgi:hypothetical protein
VNTIDDAAIRIGVARALESMTEVQLAVVAAETANKTMPTIRKQAIDGKPSIIARSGRVREGGETTIVISAEQFLNLLGGIFEAAEKSKGNFEPANAILKRLEPIGNAIDQVLIQRRKTEEEIGGRGGLFLNASVSA